jgi:hypothetical protein
MVAVGAPEIEIEFRAAFVTVNVVLPLTLPAVAVIVTGVAFTESAVITPVDAMVATEVVEDVQVAVELKFCVEPSL